MLAWIHFTLSSSISVLVCVYHPGSSSLPSSLFVGMKPGVDWFHYWETVDLRGCLWLVDLFISILCNFFFCSANC